MNNELENQIAEMSGEKHSNATGAYNAAEIERMFATYKAKLNELDDINKAILLKKNKIAEVTTSTSKPTIAILKELIGLTAKYVLLTSETNVLKAKYDEAVTAFEASAGASASATATVINGIAIAKKNAELAAAAKAAAIINAIKNAATAEEQKYHQQLLVIENKRAALESAKYAEMLAAEKVNYENSLTPSQKADRLKAQELERKIAADAAAIANAASMAKSVVAASPETVVAKAGFLKSITKKQWIIGAVVLAVLVVGCFVAYKKGVFTKKKLKS